jgi:hypothetical protein
MPQFVATFARTTYTSVSFEAADKADAARMAQTMTLAFEAVEPCDVAISAIRTAQAHEDYLEALHETPIDPGPGLQ